MAMMVLLLDDADGDLYVGQGLLSQLARLGITNLAFVRDEQKAGVVLEGWLFDPARSGRAAAEAVAAGSGARTLHPVMHLAVGTAAYEGGRDDREAQPPAT